MRRIASAVVLAIVLLASSGKCGANSGYGEQAGSAGFGLFGGRDGYGFSAWLNAFGLQKWLSSWGFQKWASNWGFQNWASSYGFQKWANSWGFQNWQTSWGFQKWAASWGFQNWANSWGFQKWTASWGFQNWASSWGFQNWQASWGFQNWVASYGFNDWRSMFGFEDWKAAYGYQRWASAWGMQSWLASWGFQNWASSWGFQRWTSNWGFEDIPTDADPGTLYIANGYGAAKDYFAGYDELQNPVRSPNKIIPVRASFMVPEACGQVVSADVANNEWMRPYVTRGADGKLRAWVGAYPSSVAHFDGDKWTTSQSPGGVTTSFGFSDSDVWMGSCSGGISHWNGSVWSGAGVAAGEASCPYAIWGAAPNDIWMPMFNQGNLYHYDGTAWTKTSTNMYAWGLHGSARDNVWAVGMYWVASPPSQQGWKHGTWRYNGSSWTRYSTVPAGTQSLYSVAAVSPTLAYAVGAGGTILKWNGSAWSLMTSGTSAQLRDVWANGANDVWAVGGGGVVLHYDGSSWKRVPAETMTLFRGISGVAAPGGGPPEVLAAGQGGVARLVRDPDAADDHLEMSLGIAAASPFDLHARTSTDVYTVGPGGTVATWDGATWHLLPRPSSVDLFAVFSPEAGRVYAGGAGGVLYYWNGSQWSTQQSGTTAVVDSMWASSPSDVYAVAGTKILRSTGNGTWSTVFTAGGTLMSIWGSGAGDVWASGVGGRLYRGSGTAWTQVPTGTTADLTQVFGASATDVSIVGYSGMTGVVLNCNGTTCNSMPGTFGVLQGGAGSRTDLWVSTDGGVWAHWDGTAWTESFRRTAAQPVNGGVMSRLPSGEIYAVAQNGPFYWDGKAWTQHQLYVPPSINNYSALDFAPTVMRLGDQNRATTSQMKLCGRPLCWEYTRDKLTSATPDVAVQGRFRRFAQAQVDMANRVFQGSGVQYYLQAVEFRAAGLPVYQLGYQNAVDNFITFLDTMSAEDRASNWRVNVFYHEALPSGALGMSRFATNPDFADKYGLHISMASDEATLAHELGHYMGLDHIFERRDPVTGAHVRGEERISRDAATRGSADCLSSGDRICDTWADPQGLPVKLGVFKDDGTTRANVDVEMACGFSECDSDASGHFASPGWRKVALGGRTLSDALGDVGDRYIRDYCFDDAETLRVNTCAQPVRCPSTPLLTCATADPSRKINLAGVEYAGCAAWGANVCTTPGSQNPEDPANQYQCGFSNLPVDQQNLSAPSASYGWLTSIPPDVLAGVELNDLAQSASYTGPVTVGAAARTHAYVPPLGIGTDNIMSYGDNYATFPNIAAFAPRKALSPTQRRLVQLTGVSGVRGQLASIDPASIVSGTPTCSAPVSTPGSAVVVPASAFVAVAGPPAGYLATVTVPMPPYGSAQVALDVTPVGATPSAASLVVGKQSVADTYVIFTVDAPGDVVATPFVLVRGDCAQVASSIKIESYATQTQQGCNDGNECTRDYVDQATGACAHAAEPDGSDCDDGQYCNGVSRCQAGVCAAGTAPDCASLDSVCATGACDEASKSCKPQAKAVGAACDDGNLCTSGDQCNASGQCAGTPQSCDDGNACTVDGSCDPATGACPAKAPLACPAGQTCNTIGGCVSAGPVISNVTATKIGTFTQKGRTFANTRFTWTTDVPSDTYVIVTAPGTGTFGSTTLVTSHSETFGLQVGYTWTYTVSSTDSSGRKGTAGPYTVVAQ